jgi:hypothetical protein
MSTSKENTTGFDLGKITEFFVDTTNNKKGNYFDTLYSGEFPVGNIYIDKYNKVPSFLSMEDDLAIDIWKDLEKEGYTLIWVSKKNKRGYTFPTAMVYFKGSTFVQITFRKEASTTHGSMYTIGDFDDDDDELERIKEAEKILPSRAKCHVYYSNEDELTEVINLLADRKVDANKKSKISLLASSSRGLYTTPQEIKTFDSFDIAMNYGKDFVKVHNKILDRLNEDKGKGLILLHGMPGTGKTSYIRYLCSLINKEIIFLPPYLAENIASPDFVPFLLEHSDSVLIIEDAERIVIDRESHDSSRQGVSNILNITDGLLGDCLSIQIIATFNTTREKIDKALLRKGRLIAEHKFDALSVENTNVLLENLGSSYRTNKPMTLTDIYNLEEELYVSQEERRTIGFNIHQ